MPKIPVDHQRKIQLKKTLKLKLLKCKHFLAKNGEEEKTQLIAKFVAWIISRAIYSGATPLCCGYGPLHCLGHCGLQPHSRLFALCFCQQLIHKLTGVAIALKTTSVWQNHLGFDHNIEGWTVFGKGAIKERISNAGSRFILLTTEHIHWIVSLRRSNLRKECYTPFLLGFRLVKQVTFCQLCLKQKEAKWGTNRYRLQITFLLHTNQPIVDPEQNAIFGVSLRSIVHIWVMRKKGPLYVAMFKPIGIIFAVIMGIAFLGDSIYLGSVLGVAITVIGFYVVIWGKSQEQAKEECEVYDDSESYSPVVPLLENKRMEE
ncbi:WAT1-related protein isoform B [Glycine soja]|uniref:WAT1-related protein isoform A n=1 Tax=Glycine soja TaxID=3848 RepID=A0A445IZ93_GLYSO|nr:WAT1-related protein isoform A [Glycine soja]RZB91437.1 WAT1-related protein isoform B [Glycine soja]